MDYSKILSHTAEGLKPSGIRKYFDMLTGMKDVISLTVGQPDFETPWHIREQGIISLERGYTYYTGNSGLPALREGISAYMARRFGLAYDSNEVIVTVGGSEAIDVAIRATVEKGDEVIIPEPSFVCYKPIVELSGGVPVIIQTKSENGFKLTAQELKNAITPRTKLLVFPFPNNPTGAIMEKAELEQIAKVLENTNIAVLSDEIYAELTYSGRHISIASLPGMRERTIIVNGFSKAYAMTGWRLGFLCAPKEIIKCMLKIHQFIVMCASTTSQIAGIEAVNHGDGDIDMMKNEYNRRRRYIIDGLREAGIDCFEPQGAFYVFPDIRKFGLDSESFCMRLLNEKKVAIVPGGAFGECGEGFARISYAYSVEHITKALTQISEFTSNLK